MQNTDSSAVLQTAGKAGKYAFGWDSDMTAYAPNAHLASAVINWVPYYINAVQDALDGTWKGGGHTWWGVKEGAIDIVSISDKVPADVKTKVETVKAGLKDGSFVIWKGPITSNDGKEMLAAGTQRRRQVPGRHQLLRQGRRGQGSGRREEVTCARRRELVLSERRIVSRMAPDFARIPRQRLPALLRAMPKAELHLHIEGTLEPELIFELAQKNGVALAYPSVEALRAAYDFTDLQSFLDIYYAGASVLLHESDFEAMAMAYFRRAAADNVVHAEVFFDPQTHTARGVPIGTVIRGLAAARERARARARRDQRADPVLPAPPERGRGDRDARRGAAVSRALHRRRPRQQRARPPAGEVRARLRRRPASSACTASPMPARKGPPAYIESALDVLHAERIDHGVRCVESPALVERLAREGVALTVCPLSNLKLRVFDRLADHNLADLLRAGIKATINSDDPAYFGGYVNDNFIATFEALPQLGAADAYALAKNSFDASFVAPEARRRWTAQLDAVFAQA